MRRPPALLITLLTATAATAADPPAVRLPDPPAVPAPMPSPSPPGAAVRLTADRLYVIDADVPVVVLASPPGLVTVSDPEPGPVRVRGRFVDSPTDRTETRTYKGKAVVTVEAAHSGTVEILVVPEGAKAPADVIRRTVEVDAGGGPRPPPAPPTPGPTPDPKPEPTPDPAKPVPLPGGGLRVLVVFETAQPVSPAQHSVLYGKEVRAWLEANCAAGPGGVKEYRIYDKDTDLSAVDAKWREAMGRKRDGTPWVIASNGAQYLEKPVPADMTPQAFVALLRPLTEGPR